MSINHFQFKITLEKPKTNFNVGAIVSVLLFIFGLSLLGSRFIGAPGISLNLPQTQTHQLQSTDGVLNIGLNDTIFFQNKLLSFDQLGDVVKEFLSHKKIPQNTTILVLIDQWASFKSVASVIDILKQSGCCKIHIACEKPQPLQI